MVIWCELCPNFLPLHFERCSQIGGEEKGEREWECRSVCILEGRAIGIHDPQKLRGPYCIILIVCYEGCLGLLELNLVTTCVIVIEGCHAEGGGGWS